MCPPVARRGDHPARYAEHSRLGCGAGQQDYGDVLDPYYAFCAFDPDGIRVEVCYWEGAPHPSHTA
jgi:hypothetical protein